MISHECPVTGINLTSSSSRGLVGISGHRRSDRNSSVPQRAIPAQRQDQRPRIWTVEPVAGHHCSSVGDGESASQWDKGNNQFHNHHND